MSAVPAIAGGIAVGILGGVAAERVSQSVLDRMDEDAATANLAAEKYVDAASRHFSAEVSSDRARNRKLDAAIEDYGLEHPAPDSVTIARTSSWDISNDPLDPNREGFWMGMGAATFVAGLLGYTMQAASDVGPRGKIVAAGVAAAATAMMGSALVSNVTM